MREKQKVTLKLTFKALNNKALKNNKHPQYRMREKQKVTLKLTFKEQ